MPLIMVKHKPEEAMGIADKTYYLDAKGKLTDAESERAYVLVNEGQEIPKHMADEYGIGKVTPPEEVVAEEAVEKKGRKPSANKSRTPTKNKGAK